MSRLIMLSNRVKMPDNNPIAGGLAVALHEILIGNSNIWMGWNGEIIETKGGGNDACDDSIISGFSTSKQTVSINNNLASTEKQPANTTITYITTALNTQQYQRFYCGFANNVLWPLLHERLDLVSQAAQDYAGYQEINRLFARQLKKTIEPDDVIWVHDYHFLSVAYYCRQLGINNRIGFFLHIPFVALSFWQQLAESAELIKHLAHYDVIGTQTQQDKTNCLKVVQHYLPERLLTKTSINPKQDFASSTAVQLMIDLDLDSSHCLSIDAYPIGVNVNKIQQQIINSSAHLLAKSTGYTQKKQLVKQATQQIIAVDRIDHSKGLLERFSAYRCFLQQYPTYQNQLKLLQIACPSRLALPVYQQLYNSVKQVVDNVNQQFLPSEPTMSYFKTEALEADDPIDNWQAITYSEEVLSHENLMTAFWHSDIGWVNSLKDGMNLVAKEYIAAQNPDNPGVLLLSRYAGAAEQMQAAVIIDPHQPKSIIQGLKTALEMPLAQRKTRYQTLLQGLQQDDLYAWQQKFLDKLYLKYPVS